MKKFKNLIGVFTVLALGLPALALANGDVAHRLGSTLEVHIADNGDVVVRGAEVTSVSDSLITARADFGATELVWRVDLDNNTKFVGKNGGTIDKDNIAVGHLISFSGDLQSGTSLTVDAEVVKDWSLNAPLKTTVNGVIDNLNVSDEEFELDTLRFGEINVDADNAVIRDEDGDTISLSDLADDKQVKVVGVYNSATRVIVAESVSILSNKPQTNNSLGEKSGLWQRLSLNFGHWGGKGNDRK